MEKQNVYDPESPGFKSRWGDSIDRATVRTTGMRNRRK